MTVHVVGNVCIDTTFQLPRFPRPGETLNASGVSDGLGGKGANQAVAASRTGANLKLWTAVGRDETARRIVEMLAAEGLDVSGLARLSEASDRSSIFVDAAGENVIVSAVPCAIAFDPRVDTDLDGEIAAGDVVVMQGNLGPSVTRNCLAFARSRGATTVVNASPLPEGGGMDLDDIDVLIVNAVEANLLTGCDTPQNGARALLGRGPRHVLLTLGADGAIVAEAGQTDFVRILAPAVVVVDTSGAGDVLCGVVAGLIALGENVEGAARIAARAASLAVTRPGTLASCPSAAEIAALRTAMAGHFPTANTAVLRATN
ncbi:ribokinase [Aureimonas sp. SA4125]|uniref:ribokinase n=1 Tax=Aureimonas sp. SA4125 TaxID=2826993 RepID=UPI001CC63451|nr:ribokinase [Aureimonas sp. SA4125]BDA84870.1 ribokinase [Aureimonas sp. SA4125]